MEDAANNNDPGIYTGHLRAPREGRKGVVLFFNGTFTPIHKGSQQN